MYNYYVGGEKAMKELEKREILMDCKILVESIGDLPFDMALPRLQNELWNIGAKYNISGADVFKIFMDDLSENKENSK